MQILKIQRGGWGEVLGVGNRVQMCSYRQWSLNRSPRATLSGDLPKLASFLHY
jgi:hypothetical protein